MFKPKRRMKSKAAVPPRIDSGSKVVVRLAGRKDARGIARLSGQLGYPVTAKNMGLRLSTVSRRTTHRLFVAEIDGRIAGWIEVFIPKSVLNWGKAEIGALVVDTRFRRKGVGMGLMHEAQVWAQRKHCPFVYLRSNIVRNEAHDFYIRSGYEVYKTQFIFRKLLTRKRQR